MAAGVDERGGTAAVRAGWTWAFGGAMTLVFLALAARLVQLQVLEYPKHAVEAARQVYGTVRERDRRGMVVDARGRTLAMSVDVKACALDPLALLEAPGAKPGRVVARLAEILSLGDSDIERITKALERRRVVDGVNGPEEKPVRFVWVKRRMTDAEWESLSGDMALARKLASDAWRNRRRWLKRAGDMVSARDKDGETRAREAAEGWKRAAQEQEGRFAGVFFPPEYERVYPQGGLAAHILGFGDIDGRGLEGVEKILEPFLKGFPVDRVVARDARSRALSPLAPDFRSAEGMTVQLTIDSVAQAIVEDELFRVVEKYKPSCPAIAANAVVMDPFTGDIVAMANYPAFDSNRPGEFPARNRRNDVVASVQEPGSTFKPLLVAASLEEGVARFEDPWDCSTLRMDNGRVIKDLYPYGKLDLLAGLVKSSNPAMVRLGLRLGPERMRDYVLKYGFGEKTGSLLPGEVGGRVTSAGKWSLYTMGSVPMGYEISVTALQMAAAYAVIANGGLLPRPNIVKAVIDARGDVALKVEPKMRRRVISAKTAGIMRSALRKVVTDGTGRRANIQEYDLGGKTGTATMIANAEERRNGIRGYSKKRNTANFVALAPWDRPRAVICVTIRETTKFGGEAAAPVVAGIARRLLAYWGVPTANGEPVVNAYVPHDQRYEQANAVPAMYTVGAEDDDNFLGEEVDPRLWEELVEDEGAIG